MINYVFQPFYIKSKYEVIPATECDKKIQEVIIVFWKSKIYWRDSFFTFYNFVFFFSFARNESQTLLQQPNANKKKFIYFFHELQVYSHILSLVTQTDVTANSSCIFKHFKFIFLSWNKTICFLFNFYTYFH